MPKITKALGGSAPKPGDPITPKEIFNILLPQGYQPNPLYGHPEYPNDQKFYVKCQKPDCKAKHISFADSKTAYTNPVSHARTCYGDANIRELVEKVRKNNSAGGSSKAQQMLIEAFQLQPTTQEEALHHWMKLVCLHNEPITKIKDRDFCSLLSCERISYKVFIDTMLELSMIVEEKIAVEMKDAKGTIVHDGWSKFSRHFVCLLACYLIATGKWDANGDMRMEMVMTLLTCTTLPCLDEPEEGDGEY
jgi:hypothetical protein